MKKSFSASITKEGELFVAQCLEIDVASQGVNENEALSNLVEALHLHLTPPVATIVPKIKAIKVEVDAA